MLAAMLAVAERGGCDIAARQGSRGYLMSAPRPARPERSVLLDASGDRHTLGELLHDERVHDELLHDERVQGQSRHDDDPVTLTCYPPQPGRAEARRTAFSR
jgi:hypothetical protein